MADWVTEIHLRQSGDIPHEDAYSKALDAAQILMSAGYDVTLRPTLPDEWFSKDAVYGD